MGKFMKLFLFSAILLSLLIVLTQAASLPYTIDVGEYSPQDIEELITLLDEMPQKRGMCRPGFTYQAILRDCVPSLGVLRGRARDGTRGRRGLGSWSTYS